jgi:hypothetical protein
VLQGLDLPSLHLGHIVLVSFQSPEIFSQWSFLATGGCWAQAEVCGQCVRGHRGGLYLEAPTLKEVKQK